MSLLLNLVKRQREWSERTFGTREARGPKGSLAHLRKETLECELTPGDIEEYADCLILLLDATWRAGFSVSELLSAAWVKMSKNEQRTWPTPVPDQPCEHDCSGA